MAEPLRRTDDIPAYDTYPAPEGTAAAANLEAPGGGAGYNPRERRSIGQATDQIAETVKPARNLARALPERLQDARERFEVVRGRVSEESLRQVENARIYAQRAFRDARIKADQMRRERPLQVVAGAAVAGLILGALLRVWRSRRA